MECPQDLVASNVEIKNNGVPQDITKALRVLDKKIDNLSDKLESTECLVNKLKETIQKGKQTSEETEATLTIKNETIGKELNDAKMSIIDLNHTLSNKDIEINDLTRKLKTSEASLIRANDREKNWNQKRLI